MVSEKMEKSALYLMDALNDCTYPMALSLLQKFRGKGVDIECVCDRIEALARVNCRSVKYMAKEVFGELFAKYDV